MNELARCGDWVLVAEGQRWIFGRQLGTGGNVVVFVLALLGVITTINGAMFAFTMSPAGLVEPAIGVGLIGLAIAWVRYRNRLRISVPVRPIVVLDFTTGWLFGPAGEPLAPLSQVAFNKNFQLFSSAWQLECSWPYSRVTVLRGDAFGGRVHPAVHALRSRGLRV